MSMGESVALGIILGFAITLGILCAFGEISV